MRSILPVLLAMALASASTASAQPRGTVIDSASTGSRQGREVSIAGARRLPLGTTVTVTGYVTVPSGMIDAGFAVSDGDNGIYVDADSALRLDTEAVRVTGRLAEIHGLLSIVPSSVEAHSYHSCSIYPIPEVATGSVSEATEGKTILTGGTMIGEVVDDRSHGRKITIDDGSGPLLVFIPAAAKIDVSRFRAGQRLRILGFSGQYDDHYEIILDSKRD